jgi:hypothetical protein
VAYHKISALPSVTQVLAPFVDYSRVPAHVLEAASERGSRVHAICAAKLLGVWHPSVTDDVAGYVRSFEGWARVVSDVVLVEPELEDTALGYCGHPDALLVIKGDAGKSAADWKTPRSCMLAWRVQLASYRNLFEVNGHEVSRQFSLRLDPNGGAAKLDEYTGTTRADFAAFLSALNAHRYFKGGK